MQQKPKPQPPRKIELYLLASESTSEYLHDIEQSLNTTSMAKPATIKFTEDENLALKFPTKDIACTFQDWIQDYFKIETNIVLLPAKVKAAASESR